MRNRRILEAAWFKIAIAVICIVVTVVTLNQFAKLIQHLLIIKYDWRFEFFMVLGMILFQYPFIRAKTWLVKLDYYLNMLLVSLMGSILLLPLLYLNYYYIHCSDTFNIAYFFAVVLIMFFDHKRRVNKLRLSWFISYTWILYRFIILIFII